MVLTTMPDGGFKQNRNWYISW